MISTVIVLATLVLAAIYAGCWLLRKDFRRQVEAPKYSFCKQVQQYDRRNQQQNPAGEESNVQK